MYEVKYLLFKCDLFLRAFVSSEQVESYWAIQGHPVVELSPQELLSCSPSLGCEGGNTCQALNWMKKVRDNLINDAKFLFECR